MQLLQRVGSTAKKIIDCPLPSLLEGIYNSRCLSRAKNVLKDSSHPGHYLFEPLPFGRHYRCIK